MAAKKKTKEEQVEIVRIHRETAIINMRGTTPLIIRRLGEKARQILLDPGSNVKTAGEKKNTLKHDPYQEFLDSPYIDEGPKAPTYLRMPAECFKNAICDVALDVPGNVHRTVMRRNTYVCGDYIPIWGIPCLKMDVVRSADKNRTPDIRTRLAVKQWAAVVRIEYSCPILSEKSIRNLAVNAGFQGVGDWRQQKGAGNYGQWEICAQNDKVFNEIIKAGGRKEQKAAMKEPDMYDRETRELLAWWEESVKGRGFKPVKCVA